MGIETAMIAAVGMSAGATVMNTLSARAQGKQEQAMHHYNAQVAAQEAESEKKLAQIESDQRRDQMRRHLSQQAAQYGMMGVTMSGSPLKVQNETAEQLALGVELAKYDRTARVKSLESESAFMRLSGDVAKLTGRRQGNAALIGGAADTAGAYANYKYYKSSSTN